MRSTALLSFSLVLLARPAVCLSRTSLPGTASTTTKKSSYLLLCNGAPTDVFSKTRCRCGGVHGALNHTRLLLSDHKRTTRLEAIELHTKHLEYQSVTLGSSTLELNLLEDPTAGLAAGPAEELTSTELETRVRVLVSSYSPELYRMLYTPFIDIIGVLVKEKLVPEGGDARQLSTTAATTSTIAGTDAGSSSFFGASSTTATAAVSGRSVNNSSTVSTSYRPVRPEEIMSHWFTDGAATLKHPHETAEAMGKRRWVHFCRALEAHWADMEAVMPLTRVVRRHGLREELYVPLFRQLAMELADPTKRSAAVATLPGLILSLANGRAPRSLGLPEKDAERIRLVSDLFLGIAQETGDTDLAYLALQLLRANSMETPFSAQKQLTNVFAAASRIETDWQMRGASLLVECYPKWLEYFREVQRDNKVALERLKAADARADDTEGQHDEDGAAAQAGRERRLSTLTSPSSYDAQPVTKKSNKRITKKATAQDNTACSVGGEVASGKETGETKDGMKKAVEGSDEQYRYFTSRSQDDVTRITALEANIAAAVRARAAELEGVRLRRRRPRRQPLKIGALCDVEQQTPEATTMSVASTSTNRASPAKKRAPRRLSREDSHEGDDVKCVEEGDNMSKGAADDIGSKAKKALCRHRRRKVANAKNQGKEEVNCSEVVSTAKTSRNPANSEKTKKVAKPHIIEEDDHVMHVLDL